MTVYVDDMFQYPIGQFGRMKMSHMIADSEEELFAMCRKIGVQTKWYQRDHFDVAMSKREAAILNGAIPITYKQCGAMCAVRRITGKLPNPSEAIKLLLELMEEKRNGHGNHQG